MGGRHIGTRLGQKVETVTRRGRGRARRSGKSRSGDEGKMGRQVRAQGTGAVATNGLVISWCLMSNVNDTCNERMTQKHIPRLARQILEPGIIHIPQRLPKNDLVVIASLRMIVQPLADGWYGCWADERRSASRLDVGEQADHLGQHGSIQQVPGRWARDVPTRAWSDESRWCVNQSPSMCLVQNS
jgi:hypothetical protein